MRTSLRLPAAASGLILAAGLVGAAPAMASGVDRTHTVSCSGNGTTVRVVLPAELATPDPESRTCGYFTSSFRRVVLVQTNPKRSLRHLSKRAAGESELSHVRFTAHGVGFAGGRGARLSYVLRPKDGSGTSRAVIVQDQGVRFAWSTPLRQWDAHKAELRKALRSVRVTH